MKKAFTFLFLLFSIWTFAQVNYTANDTNDPYSGVFRPGANLGYFSGWRTSELGELAAGNPANGILGVGAKVVRPVLPESVLENYGYDVAVDDFELWKSLGMDEFTATLAFPADWHRDQTEYCPGVQSSMFKNLHTPIWDGGANGTPYNDDNYFAAYVYKTVVIYDEYVKFWEIWNEPGFDETGNTGWRDQGYNPPFGNWWDSDPQPCDYILHAPIEDYVRTLRIAYDIIKTLSPDDYVVVAGFGYQSFLDAVLRNTDNPVDGSVTPDHPFGGGAYFDFMGLHSYPHFDGTTTNNSANFFERHSDRAAQGLVYRRGFYQEILDNYGYDGTTYPLKQTMATEMNVPRFYAPGNFFASVDGQRNYIMKSFVTAILNNVPQFHVYGLSDRPGRGFGFDVMGLYEDLDAVDPYEQVMNTEGFAMKTTSDMLWGTTYDAAKTAQMNVPSGSKGYAFLQPDGDYVYMLWAETTIDQSEFAQGTYNFPSSFGYSTLDKIEWDYSQSGQIGTSNATGIQLDATPIFLIDGFECTDDDNDGTCASVDCDDNNPNLPTTPGSSCDDENSNTINDEIQADGCTCEGTPFVNPNCTVGYSNTDGGIKFTGLAGNRSSVLLLDPSWQSYYSCSFNCSPSVTISGLTIGDVYYVKLKQYDDNGQEICSIEEFVTISGGGGCTDNDDDGTCADDDCDDNDPSVPATVGSSCDDGNSNTTNDEIQADGCTCEGTPVTGGCTLDYTINNGSITVTGLGSGPSSLRIMDSSWSTVYTCNYNCDPTETITGLTNGASYYLKIRLFDNSYEEVCRIEETVTINGGGCTDNDDDGVCAADDCDDNDPTVPTTVGSSCDDGNSNTTNDEIQADGCTCEGTPIGGGNCDDLSYTVQGNSIIVTGLNQPHIILKLFTPSWSTYYTCVDNCNATENLGPLSEGVYNLKINVYDADWDQLCEINEFLEIGSSSTLLQAIDNDFLFFNALKAERSVQLNWVTDASNKTDHFILERSLDGDQFSTIGDVVSLEDIEQAITYQFNDDQPNQGLNFYRVKQVFEDGNIQYSALRQVTFEQDVFDFAIFPNPNSGNLFVHLKDFAGDKADVIIYNQLGQTVQSITLNDVPNHPVRLNLNDLQDGLYHIAVKVDNQRMLSKKFILNKL